MCRSVFRASCLHFTLPLVALAGCVRVGERVGLDPRVRVSDAPLPSKVVSPAVSLWIRGVPLEAWCPLLRLASLRKRSIPSSGWHPFSPPFSRQYRSARRHRLDFLGLVPRAFPPQLCSARGLRGLLPAPYLFTLLEPRVTSVPLIAPGRACSQRSTVRFARTASSSSVCAPMNSFPSCLIRVLLSPYSALLFGLLNSSFDIIAALHTHLSILVSRSSSVCLHPRRGPNLWDSVCKDG